MCTNPVSGMIAALAALESKGRNEVTHIKAENLIIININVEDQNGRERNDAAAGKDNDAAAAEQLMLLQVNQLLLRDQKANAAQKEIDNVFRAAVMAQRDRERSTVMVVVTEIKTQVAVVDSTGEKRAIEANVFKQEAIVANRGKEETQTVMSKRFTYLLRACADLMASP